MPDYPTVAAPSRRERVILRLLRDVVALEAQVKDLKGKLTDLATVAAGLAEERDELRRRLGEK